MSPFLALLAELPESTVYINPLKLGAVFVVYLVWVLLAQWVDKDTVAVNTYRILWNFIVLGAGAAALLVLVAVPVFAIALPAMVVMVLAVGLVYVLHRNKLVKEDHRVLTRAHFRRLKEEGIFGKKKVKEVKERVRLTNAQRKVVPVPTEDPEREYYRLTQDLMFNALWRRAAVLELAPGGPQAYKITLLVDGMPVEAEPLPRSEGEAVLQYIKIMAGLSLEERRKPQKGQIMVSPGETKHKVFVRTDGSTAGEKITIRIIYNEADYKVPDLGFTPRQLEQVLATKDETKGLIVLSAPPGQGLTTSLYSFTRTHDRYLQNVQMIEYDKELDVDNVTQTLFAPDGPPFAERLLKLVRADPDIIVLPELREREAAAVAAKAAAEKQKVYVGVIANDVFEALRKWIALVGDKSLAARGLIGVGNQRLVRKLCRECKQAYKPEPAMMRKLNMPEDKVLYRVPEPPPVDKHGNPIICPACQGVGYMGRTAVFDWLVVDEPLREVIRRSSALEDIKSYAMKRGGLGLQTQALQKVLEGVTSIKEVARVVKGEEAAAGAKPAVRPGAAPQPRPAPRPAPNPQTGGGAGQPTGGR